MTDEYTVFASSTVMFERLVHQPNTFSPILVTLDGMKMLVRLLQASNAWLPIAVTVSPASDMFGMTISVSVQVPIPLT